MADLRLTSRAVLEAGDGRMSLPDYPDGAACPDLRRSGETDVGTFLLHLTLGIFGNHPPCALHNSTGHNH